METRTQFRLGAAIEKNRSLNEAGFSAHRSWGALRIPCREFPPATTLILQGCPAREVFCVERGLIKITHLNASGQEAVVGLRSKGSILGAASVIVQEPHPITAITATSCSLSCIPAELFIRLAKTDEQFCWHLHQIHSHEVHQQASQFAALRYMSARQRFEKLLLQFLSSIAPPEKQPSPQEKQTSMKIRLPLKHWEIAQLICITPEHLSRVLKQIKQEGVMYEEDGCIIVSDVRKLRSQDDCE